MKTIKNVFLALFIGYVTMLVYGIFLILAFKYTYEEIDFGLGMIFTLVTIYIHKILSDE